MSFRIRAMLAPLLLLVSLTFVLPHAAAQPVGEPGRPDQAVIVPEPGILSAAVDQGYLSSPMATARPFTHLLVRREANVPAGAVLMLSVRISKDGAAWSDWRMLEDDADLWMPADGPDTAWSQVVDVGGTARFWQLRGVFAPAPSGALPELRRIEVNTVDAFSFGPTSATSGGAPKASGAVAKPAMVSRTAWGSPDGQGSRVRPAYYPVNHLILHHTADSDTLYTSEPNWAARVRAIWSFHTYTRGWGDIGYNYLIDRNGVIYEGRAGGDDAVGFHDAANYGSVGVSVMGTWTKQPMPAAATDAVVRLMAWKASQKNIDPLGQSYYYGCDISSRCRPSHPGAIVQNVAGHKQVTPGYTADPSDLTIAILPDIRNRIKNLISGAGADDGDLVIDELESGFARSDTNWHTGGCGYGGNTLYTYATDSAAESTNSATWRPAIPTSGRYRVYVHIPQGCALAAPPYASAKARYTITFMGGTATRLVDQNAADEWADLGVYSFDAGTSGAVALSDLTGEPYSQRRVVFFDAVKWVPESADAGVELAGVRFDRTTVASGELLKVTFTVRNTGDTTLRTQAPQAGAAPDGGFSDGLNGRADDAYVYDEGECFAGNTDATYPAFPKESNRFRMVLGPNDTSAITCVSAFGGYPWRWGLNGDLLPGATRDIVGYVRFRNDGSANRVLTLRAGIIQEYVRYFAQDSAATSITVTPERVDPDAAAYDAALRPLARVYRLGAIPDNFLARTRNPLSIPRGDYVGSIVWDGTFMDWGAGGPFGLSDRFLVEQTRAFLAPVSGQYTFRTTSDDGSWLWVDGKPVVINNGLHPAADATGTVTLDAGVHVIAFKYFERGGVAAMGYGVQLPGNTSFVTPSDALGGSALHLGSTFAQTPDLAIVADDHGGAGVDRIRWSWDGANWDESPGAVLRTGKLQNGSYRLRYQPIDRAGNQGALSELAFQVNTAIRMYQSYLPQLAR